jgi:hypothetical protein
VGFADIEAWELKVIDSIEGLGHARWSFRHIA